MPLWLLHLAGSALGILTYRASNDYRLHLDTNLKQAGYADRATRTAAIREAGKAIAELPAVWLRPPDAVARLLSRPAAGNTSTPPMQPAAPSFS